MKILIIEDAIPALNRIKKLVLESGAKYRDFGNS
jgi:hypothetical protein